MYKILNVNKIRTFIPENLIPQKSLIYNDEKKNKNQKKKKKKTYFIHLNGNIIVSQNILNQVTYLFYITINAYIHTIHSCQFELIVKFESLIKLKYFFESKAKDFNSHPYLVDSNFRQINFFENPQKFELLRID
eukprot:TRINITY_DN3673_c0_g3_i1.p2 TRINITY_DN3673_c0_g3~~TRINITY_DN3673_c0_g3_i1.p2  ORF type:complete len:153 (+),score=2.00 TRINITY_DN3673_c0_g3_i1:60-461(+)